MTEILSKEEREALLQETTTDKLIKMNIAHTPKSWDEIVAFTANASTPADAATAALMAWNLAVEWHHQQDRCCEKMRQIKAMFDDELTYAEHLAAKSGDE
jgi:hypothetical protein